jgi:F-type H+-transporting ATPase subunit gamma
VALLVVTGDRGLAGPFNGQVLRRAFELERRERAEGHEVVWTIVGRKGASTLRFRRYEVAASWDGFVDRPTYADAQAVAHTLAELYTNGDVDRVVLVYNRFESALVQRVTTTDLLPIPEDVLERHEEDVSDREQALRGDFIYEPEPEEILQRLLPVYLETEIYRALLESAAAFLAAQMTAMRNASKNAGELIDNLTLAMNRARQAQITQEILEIVAGADALTQ